MTTLNTGMCAWKEMIGGLSATSMQTMVTGCCGAEQQQSDMGLHALRFAHPKHMKANRLNRHLKGSNILVEFQWAETGYHLKVVWLGR